MAESIIGVAINKQNKLVLVVTYELEMDEAKKIACALERGISQIEAEEARERAGQQRPN